MLTLLSFSLLFVSFELSHGFATLFGFDLLFFFLLCCHWIGCLTFFIPLAEGMQPDSWVSRQELQQRSLAQQYSTSLLSGVSQMLAASATYGGEDKRG